MAAQWFYARSTRQFGPVSWEQLQELAHSGTLAPTDLVWNETEPQWTPAGRRAGLIFPGQAADAVTPLPSTAEGVPLSGDGDEHGNAGLNRFLSASALESLSQPMAAIALTLSILFVVVVLGNPTLFEAFIVASAAAIYYDASEHRIGRVPPPSLTSNSAGMWALGVILFWILCFPLYLIKRPALIERARSNPRDASGRTWKLTVLGALAVLFFLAGLLAYVRRFQGLP